MEKRDHEESTIKRRLARLSHDELCSREKEMHHRFAIEFQHNLKKNEVNELSSVMEFGSNESALSLQ